MHDDELIDRAAHAMTRGEPSDRLRPDVRARIEKGPSRLGAPEPWRRWKQTLRFWIPALASAAAIVVLAATMVWRPESGRPATVSAPGTVAPAPAVVSRVEPPVVESPAVSAAPAPQARRARATSTAPRIAVIDPLQIEPLSVPLMAVDANSGAMPMEIQPLQIEPLQPQ